MMRILISPLLIQPWVGGDTDAYFSNLKITKGKDKKIDMLLSKISGRYSRRIVADL
jgi:hypothetical protein